MVCMTQVIRTASDVIDELGGNIPVAELISTPERKVTNKAVANWRTMGLPWKTQATIMAALQERGKTADPSVFGMKAKVAS